MRGKNVILLSCIMGLGFLYGCESTEHIAVPDEEEYLQNAVEEQVTLTNDTEIEAYEWVDEEETCFRVRVQYKEQPENEYRHKEDYFLFIEDEAVSQVLHVEYPSKMVDVTPEMSERYVWDACDFNAHLEDVTFDGNRDLIISLGNSGVHATPVSCVYVYEDGEYCYEKTFENIPDYEADAEQQVIRGRAAGSAASYTEYIFEYQDGEFIQISQKTYENDEAEEYEDVTELFDTITVDMLDASNMLPSVDAYFNDALVLLNWYGDDVRLYGISAGEESEMLLYVQGEKVLIDHSYRNMHVSYPKLNVWDADSDGEEEVVISYETLTGSPGCWYELLVCDNEGEWVVHDYDSYVEDVEAFIDYQYDEDTNTITFLCKTVGTVLTEVTLPEWTEENPYLGEIDFADYIRFDAETMKLEVQPFILLENSLPYMPVRITFDIQYQDGEFELVEYEVQDLI